MAGGRGTRQEVGNLCRCTRCRSRADRMSQIPCCKVKPIVVIMKIIDAIISVRRFDPGTAYARLQFDLTPRRR